MTASNRITLDFIKHESAKQAIKAKLLSLNCTDVNITNLNITCDGGYVIYNITINNRVYGFFDSGSEFDVKQPTDKISKMKRIIEDMYVNYKIGTLESHLKEADNEKEIFKIIFDKK